MVLGRRFLAVLMVMVMLLTGAVPAMAAKSGGSSQAKAGTSQQKKTTKKSTKKTTKKATKKTTKKTTKKSTKKTTKKATKKAAKKTTKKSTKKAAKKTTKKNNKATSRGSSGFDAGKIIRYALTLKGAPYRSGGTTPEGFDCSGFTTYVFKNSVGIDLPHSSASQAAMGQALKKDEPVPGALVYFNTSGGGVSHVGIYIGDDKFIDSSNSKGVAVNSLKDDYWGSRYMGARLVK